MDELPEGFLYVTKSHIVVGTGTKNNVEKVKKDEGLRPQKRK